MYIVSVLQMFVAMYSLIILFSLRAFDAAIINKTGYS